MVTEGGREGGRERERGGGRVLPYKKIDSYCISDLRLLL